MRDCFTGRSRCGGQQEGYVVRLEGSFPVGDFNQSIAKYVRPGHVQTDDGWLRQRVVKNGLAYVQERRS